MDTHSTILLLLLALLTRFSHELPSIRPRWVDKPKGLPQFAFVIYIEMSKAKDGFCTGTMISDRWVLTAARCMYRDGKVVETDKSITLHAGLTSRHDKEGPTAQMRQSKSLKMFPGTKQNSGYYEIALIEVDRPFKLDAKTNIIPVSVKGYNHLGSTRCSSGSHGQTDWNNPESSKSMKELVFNTKSCQCPKALQKTYPSTNTSRWICGRTELVCKGDFGAGLICDGELQAVSVELMKVSGTDGNDTDCKGVQYQTNEKCGQGTIPAYTDICYYLKWLDSYVPDVTINTVPCDDIEKSATAVLRSNCAIITVWCFYVLN